MKKILISALVLTIGLGSLINYKPSSAINWNADNSAYGKYIKKINGEIMPRLILETINKRKLVVYVSNCKRNPISKLFNEIKPGDYLEVGCGLYSENEKTIDCFSDSCMIKKPSLNTLEKIKQYYK